MATLFEAGEKYDSCLRYELGTKELLKGGTLLKAFLAYKTYGSLNDAGDNCIVLPTFYTGTHASNEKFFMGVGRSIDPSKYFIVSINMFGNGVSSSPSNTPPPHDGPRFPLTTLYDNISCQYELLRHLGVNQIALVVGWSMAGCQCYQWAAQYPTFVLSILPFCASAKISIHNHVFLEGVKAALCADSHFQLGEYTSPPTPGLKAFGRVYAGNRTPILSYPILL